MTRRTLRYELSAFRAMIADLADDPERSLYYDGAAVRSRGARPLPGLLEDVARTLYGFVPAMSPALRGRLSSLLGSGPWFEHPGILFTLWEAVLGASCPVARARRMKPAKRTIYRLS